MAASRPEQQRALLAAALISAALTTPGHATAQDTTTGDRDPAALGGTVYVGEALMTDGTVVLHHLTEGAPGTLDSVDIGQDGTFRFELPWAPDPARGDVYFASVRHHGVLYFGQAITQAAQLDSAYTVTAYDTLLAPARGMAVPLRSRSVFLEPDSAGTWRVTDIFQLFNDRDRTLVTREGGYVWAHPLPSAATDVVAGEGELSFAAAEYEEGRLVVRAAIPPGERLFVVRYRLPDVEVEIPNVGPAGAFDLLVREPAPPVTVSELELRDRIELEAGSTYIRFTGVDVVAPSLTVARGERPSPPRVEWVALLLAIVLGGAGLYVLRPRPTPVGAGGSAAVVDEDRPRRAAPPSVEREALLHQIARLDEDFASGPRGAEERVEYERRRSALLRRVRAL